MVASPLSEHAETLVNVPRYDLDLLRCSAIYGPNASGKSNVFGALAFMIAAIRDSHRVWTPDAEIPRTAFLLESSYFHAPSTFVVDFLVADVHYEYGFEVDSARVLREWLFAFPRNRKQEWFTRDVHRDKEFNFSRHMSGENRAISGLTRPNSLFLSAAAQNNHTLLLPIHQWLTESTVVDRTARFIAEFNADQACKDSSIRAGVLKLLRTADLGIVDMEVVESDHTSLWDQLFNRDVREVRLHHRAAQGSTVTPLPFESESDGTRTLFTFAAPIVLKLRDGGVLVVDELDRSLHPHLAMHIVRLFNDPETNPKNAQLIFNTHDTNLLDTSLMRRDQIWFTEKGDDGATRLFPLTDYRARKSENIERGYLQGRYGAVPSLRTPEVLRKAAG